MSEKWTNCLQNRMTCQRRERNNLFCDKEKRIVFSVFSMSKPILLAAISFEGHQKRELFWLAKGPSRTRTRQPPRTDGRWGHNTAKQSDFRLRRLHFCFAEKKMPGHKNSPPGLRRKKKYFH